MERERGLWIRRLGKINTVSSLAILTLYNWEGKDIAFDPIRSCDVFRYQKAFPLKLHLVQISNAYSFPAHNTNGYMSS